MNEEKNNPENEAETNSGAGNEPLKTGGVSYSDNPNAQPQDDYYAVDHAKKDVLSTIGDGEMHDEGLVGEGDPASDISSSQERLSNEQDEAEMHDSEG